VAGVYICGSECSNFFVAGKFLTRWPNAGVSRALFLGNRKKENKRERD
jgi:hypothetical protein